MAVPTSHRTAQGSSMLSARERMDIISAYQQVGTYRGAAEICGTTHKTVRRVIERAEAGETAGRRGSERPRNYDAVTELVAARVKHRRAGSRRNGCCRSRRRPGTRGRRGTSAGWSRRRKRCGAGIITVVGGRRCGHRVSTWSSTGPTSAPGCTCSARCWRGRGGGSSRSPPTSGPPPRWR